MSNLLMKTQTLCLSTVTPLGCVDGKVALIDVTVTKICYRAP